MFNFALSLRKSIQTCCILLLIPFLWFPELAYTMVQLLCTFPVYHKVLQDCLELLPPVNSREILNKLEFADTSIWQMNRSAMHSCFQIFHAQGRPLEICKWRNNYYWMHTYTNDERKKTKSLNIFASFVEMSFSASIFFICSSLTKLPLTSILRAALLHTVYMKWDNHINFKHQVQKLDLHFI